MCTVPVTLGSLRSVRRDEFFSHELLDLSHTRFHTDGKARMNDHTRHAPITSSGEALRKIGTQYVASIPLGWSVLVFAITLLIIFPLQKVALPYIANQCIAACRSSRGDDAMPLRTPATHFVLIVLVVAGLRILMYYTGLDLQNVLNVNTRDHMTRRILHAHQHATHNPQVGNWITHVENVGSIVQLVFCKFINTIVPEMASFLTIGLFLCYVDAYIGGAYFVALAIFGATFAYGVRFSQRAAMRDYEQRVHLNEHMQNMLFNMPYIQAANSLRFEERGITKKLDELATRKNAFLHTNTRFLAVLDVSTLAFVLFAVYMLYRRMQQGKSVTTLLSTTFLVLMIFVKDFDDFKKTLTEICNFSYTTSLFETMMQRDRARLQQRMHRVPGVPARGRVRGASSSSDHNEGGAPPSAVVLDAIRLHTPGRRRLPLTLSLRLARHRLHGIHGRSGTGKTTLAHVLAGIAQPESGAIWMHGRDVTNTMAQRRASTVYMPQHAQLFNGTLYDNLVYTEKPRWSRAKVHALVRDSGLLPVLQQTSSRRTRCDAYLDRRIQNEGSNVSGGQKQVIMFLRTLVLASARQGKDVLFILDEPHTALDPQSEKLFMQRLRLLATEHTVLLITHSPRALAQCDTQHRLVAPP